MSQRRAERVARRKWLMERKGRRARYRNREAKVVNDGRPVFRGSNIHYEMAERDHNGMVAGGLGALHRLVAKLELAKLIDDNVRVLKRRAPYYESDHVLNMAYNLLSGGDCLDDLNDKRNSEAYLDTLGAARIPHATTAGDFCRRFDESDIVSLMEALNEARQRVWHQQDASFFNEACLDMDGVLVETTGECKEGMDISFKKTWGYSVGLLSLRQTGEPLFIVNRSGNRRSEDGMASWVDKGIELLENAGFKRINLAGDSAFSQTKYLDGWDDRGVGFLFSYPARPKLQKLAAELEDSSWTPLERPEKYEVKTSRRQRPDNVKDRIVNDRGYKVLRLASEAIAEIDYQPWECAKTYRMVILRKNIAVQKGQEVLFPETRYLFYITNDRSSEPSQIVFAANKRCAQEALIGQLKSDVQALGAPLNTLESNWAYMIAASLAWTLKCWFALILPVDGLCTRKHKAEKLKILQMGFQSFVKKLMLMPAKIVKKARRIVVRLMCWTPLQRVFLRSLEVLETPTPLRC